MCTLAWPTYDKNAWQTNMSWVSHAFINTVADWSEIKICQTSLLGKSIFPNVFVKATNICEKRLFSSLVGIVFFFHRFSPSPSLSHNFKSVFIFSVVSLACLYALSIFNKCRHFIVAHCRQLYSRNSVYLSLHLAPIPLFSSTNDAFSATCDVCVGLKVQIPWDIPTRF